MTKRQQTTRKAKKKPQAKPTASKKPRATAANNAANAEKRAAQTSKAAATPPKKKSANVTKNQGQHAAQKGANSTVGKIMKTTDGFLGNRSNIKKPRRVAVIEQREDDGAVAIVRIFKKKGKRADDPHAYVQELTLLPQDHTSLTEESIVEAKVILGVNTAQGKKAIFTKSKKW